MYLLLVFNETQIYKILLGLHNTFLQGFYTFKKEYKRCDYKISILRGFSKSIGNNLEITQVNKKKTY